jgi:hypothetical protein
MEMQSSQMAVRYWSQGQQDRTTEMKNTILRFLPTGLNFVALQIFKKITDLTFWVFGAEVFLKAGSRSPSQEMCPPFMEPQGCLQTSQQPPVKPYSEPDDSSPLPHT